MEVTKYIYLLPVLGSISQISVLGVSQYFSLYVLHLHRDIGTKETFVTVILQVCQRHCWVQRNKQFVVA